MLKTDEAYQSRFLNKWQNDILALAKVISY